MLERRLDKGGVLPVVMAHVRLAVGQVAAAIARGQKLAPYPRAPLINGHHSAQSGRGNSRRQTRRAAANDGDKGLILHNISSLLI